MLCISIRFLNIYYPCKVRITDDLKVRIKKAMTEEHGREGWYCAFAFRTCRLKFIVGDGTDKYVFIMCWKNYLLYNCEWVTDSMKKILNERLPTVKFHF